MIVSTVSRSSSPSLSSLCCGFFFETGFGCVALFLRVPAVGLTRGSKCGAGVERELGSNSRSRLNLEMPFCCGEDDCCCCCGCWRWGWGDDSKSPPKSSLSPSNWDWWRRGGARDWEWEWSWLDWLFCHWLPPPPRFDPCVVLTLVSNCEAPIPIVISFPKECELNWDDGGWVWVWDWELFAMVAKVVIKTSSNNCDASFS